MFFFVKQTVYFLRIQKDIQCLVLKKIWLKRKMSNERDSVSYSIAKAIYA